MNSIFKNPITVWLSWYIKTIKLLRYNKNKNLKIGYLSNVHNVEFGKYDTIYDCVNLSNSTIGDFVYISKGTNISNTIIGKFCSISSNVKIGLPMHPTHFISTFPAFFSERKQCQLTFTEMTHFEEIGKVYIGNDVWIGESAIILTDVRIGDGAIIAAGAVVTKDVEPYSIVGGVPAKTIRYRFTNEKITHLLNFKWWNKEIEWIKDNHLLFVDSEIFFKKIRRN